MTRIFLAPAAALLLLAACAGGASGTRTLAGCPDALPYVELLYPQSGSSGIPDGNFTLVTSGAFGTSLTLAPANNMPATSTTPGAPVPSPLPTPNSTPPPGSQPYGYGVPALQPSTAYNVIVTFAPLGGPACPPAKSTIGTFTTR